MAFTKYADCEVLNFSCSRKGQRTAALAKIGSFEYEPATDGNYLYVAVRACTADVPNLNLDMLPSWELETAYETFRGASVFLNHDNSDPAKARGVVVDAKYHDEDPDDKWVEILMEMDEDRCPKLCSLIRSGEMDTVSMGANVESTTCSVCGNVAEYPFQYCTHVQQKGREFDGKVAFEICNGIEFFEESWVYDPADPTAHAMTMMDSDGTFTSEGCDDMGVAKWSKRASGGLVWDRQGDVALAEVPDGWLAVLVDRDILTGRAYLSVSFTDDVEERDVEIYDGPFDGDGYEEGMRIAEEWYVGKGGRSASISPRDVAYLRKLTDSLFIDPNADVRGYSDKLVDEVNHGPYSAGDVSVYDVVRDGSDYVGAYWLSLQDPASGYWFNISGMVVAPFDRVERMDGTVGDVLGQIVVEELERAAAQGVRVAAFSDEPRTPAPVDTKETDKECPACGEDTFDGETCSTCGYTEPPEGMDDIDLDDDDEVEDVEDEGDESEGDGKGSRVGASGRLLDIYVSSQGGYLYVEATVSDQGGNPLTSVELDIDVPDGWGFGDSHDFTEKELYDYGIDPSDPYGSQWAIWEYMGAYTPEGYEKSGAMEAEFRFW